MGLTPQQFQILLNNPMWLKYLQTLQQPTLSSINAKMVRPAFTPNISPTPMVGVRG